MGVNILTPEEVFPDLKNSTYTPLIKDMLTIVESDTKH